MPYVIDGDGNCHVYVDAAADLDMAVRIVVNAKMQRPGVCNAAEIPARSRGGRRRLPAPAGRRPRRVSSSSAMSGPGSSFPAWAVADRRRLRHRVPRPEAGGGGRRRSRRGHRPHRPVRLGPLRGHRDDDLAAAERFCREVDAAPWWSMPRPGSSTAASSASGPRSGSPPRSSTPAARWASASSPATKYVIHGDGQVRG